MLRRNEASATAASATEASATAEPNGFTLIELVISVAILGLVMTAMAAMIATTLSVGQATEHRLDSSNALRRVERQFATDVASATEVVTGETAKCGGGTALIELRGKTFGEPPLITPAVEPAVFTTAVAYVLGPGKQLTRRVCRGSSAAETVELAAALDAATVTCAPSCSSPDPVYTLTLTPPDSDPQVFSASRRTS